MSKYAAAANVKPFTTHPEHLAIYIPCLAVEPNEGFRQETEPISDLPLGCEQ
jgi:hypothetical protein